MAVYDKAQWHYECDSFPADVPQFQAYVHTGFFIAWIVENELYTQFVSDYYAEALEACKRREITGAELYERCLQGVFDQRLLSEPGNLFVRQYYDTSGAFFEDLFSAFSENEDYRIEDTWENYERIRPLIDQRFRGWLSEQAGEINDLFDASRDLDSDYLTGVLTDRLNLSESDVTSVVDCLQEVIMEKIANGASVTLEGLGTFEPRQLSDLTINGRHSGTTVKIPQRSYVAFAAALPFKTAVEQPISV